MRRLQRARRRRAGDAAWRRLGDLTMCSSLLGDRRAWPAGPPFEIEPRRGRGRDRVLPRAAPPGVRRASRGCSPATTSTTTTTTRGRWCWWPGTVRATSSAGSGSARPTRRPGPRLVAGGRLAVDPASRTSPSRRSWESGPRWSGRRARTPRAAGVLRFEATVQARSEPMFTRLGWQPVRPVTVAGAPHVLMRWPIGRIAALAAATKSSLGPLLAGCWPWPGCPASSATTASRCRAATWSRRATRSSRRWSSATRSGRAGARCWSTSTTWPRWAPRRSALLDALGARDASFAARVLAGLRRASAAYGVPVLGGHTQLGVPAALSVTALGRAGRIRCPAAAAGPGTGCG